MKFYEVDNALKEAIIAADKPVRLKIEIDLGNRFESVFEQDVIEANFYGLQEAAGGTSSRGEVLLDNQVGIYTYPNSNVGAGTQVKVSFSLGEGLPYFQRFNFYIDDKGIQDVRGPGRKRCVRLTLRDFSEKLRITDEANDWTAPAVFTYSVVCDKSQPQRSLVHGIAHRAGLAVTDIDCSTIPVTLPYVKLTKNIWAELSCLATAYRCHLECPVEKPLMFAHSPYQTERIFDDEYSYTFTGNDVFYFRTIDRAELYRNSIRLKVNMPVVLERQEIWQYDEPPVFYDDALKPYYPFQLSLVRKIEMGFYEGRYQTTDTFGGHKTVVYADEIDTQEEAENRIDYDGGPFSYSNYDVSTNHNKAILQLRKTGDGNINKAAIHGRPIVIDHNRAFFIRDDREIAARGLAVLNVSGSYFSDYEIDGRRQYEDWAVRELAERIQNKREFTVKTHRALFNARVGAKVKIMSKEQRTESKEEMTGTITAFSFRYRENAAFVAAFKIREQ